MQKIGSSWLAYLLAVHLALAAAAWKIASPRLQNDPVAAALPFHQVMDTQVPAGTAVFLGDSITATLAVAAVDPVSVNFGIGGEHSWQLLAALPTYRSLARAKRIYVMIGTNDVREGNAAGLAQRYRELLARLPPNVPVVMSTIPPMASQDVDPFAAMARDACAGDARCTLVDLHAALSVQGRPRQGVLQPDGTHLSAAGYAVWIALLRSVHDDHAIP